MISTARWEAECQLMVKHFPQFEPFLCPAEGIFALEGTIVGKHSGTAYKVILRLFVLLNRQE